MAGRTTYDRIWDDHAIGDDLLYVDLHLVHEVTSAQAFEGLRLAGGASGGRIARSRPRTTTCPPPISHGAVEDDLCRAQLDALTRNCEEFGVPLYGLGHRRQGIVHVIGPELGVTQPGMTIVCGDSHTSTHGAFGALAFGMGTSEVEHVLATQTLPQKRAAQMRVSFEGEPGRGVEAKDFVLGLIARIGTDGATGHIVEYAGPAIRALAMEGRMTISNMSIEAGARAGLIAADETTFAFLEGRPGVHGSYPDAVERWSRYRTDDDATFDREVVVRVDELAPQVSWGTNPGQVVPITGVGARAGRRGRRARAQLHGPAPRNGDAGRAHRPRVPRLVHQRPSHRPARGGRCRARAPRRRARARDGRAGLDGGQGGGGGRGSRSRLRRRRVRVAQRRLLDVPRHEPRHPAAGRALRLDQQPQLRGPPGTGRTHPSDEPADGGSRSHRRPPRRREGGVVEPVTVVRGTVAALDRANVDTDQIIPKQFLKRIERSGFGEFLFWDWRKEPDFPLNRPEFAGAPILACGRNFGSGSSREHAPWALEDAGYRAIVAPSFGDIFRTNCSKIGLLAVVLPEATYASCSTPLRPRPSVDLERLVVTMPSGREVAFSYDADVRDRLLNGWDDIALTLLRGDEIAAYERERERPGPSTVAL